MKNQEPKKIKVKLIRPVRLDGKRVEAGEVLELDTPQARELVANNKASTDMKAKIVLPAKISTGAAE